MSLLHLFLHTALQIEVNNHNAKIARFEFIEYHKEQLRLAVETGDERLEADYLLRLGNAYATCADYQMSDTIYRQSLALARQLSDQLLETIALVNLGLSFKQRLDYTEAYSYYRKALAIVREIGEREFEQKILEHIDELDKMMSLEKSARDLNQK